MSELPSIASERSVGVNFGGLALRARLPPLVTGPAGQHSRRGAQA